MSTCLRCLVEYGELYLLTFLCFYCLLCIVSSYLCDYLNLSSSLHFNSHFPGEPGLAGVYWSKEWWWWWWQLDYWSYKSCKAPVKSSPPTNKHPVFYRPDALPIAQPTVSEHWRKNITFHGLAYPKLTWGLPTCLWPLVAPGYLNLSSSLTIKCFSSLKNVVAPWKYWWRVLESTGKVFEFLTYLWEPW